LQLGAARRGLGAAVCSAILEGGSFAKNRCYVSAMAIKFRAKTKEELPTELQSLYVERDGAFVLDVEVDTITGACEIEKVIEGRVRVLKSDLEKQYAGDSD